MKVRNGFVSNSSSSSFIVAADSIKDYLISRAETVEGEHYGEENFYKGTIKALMKVLKDKRYVDFLEGKVGIVLPSCNYHTYVYKNGDEFWSASCRNHCWPDVEGVTCHGEDGDKAREIDDYVLDKIKQYMDVRWGFDHSSEVWPENVEAKKVCPHCRKEAWWYYIDKGLAKLCSFCGKPLDIVSPMAVAKKIGLLRKRTKKKTKK